MFTFAVQSRTQLLYPVRFLDTQPQFVGGRCNYPESDRGRIGRMFIDIVFRNCSAIISSLHGIQVFSRMYMQGPCGGTDVSPTANGTFGFINHQGPGTLAAMIRYWAFPQGALLRRSWSLGNLLYCHRPWVY